MNEQPINQQPQQIQPQPQSFTGESSPVQEQKKSNSATMIFILVGLLIIAAIAYLAFSLIAKNINPQKSLSLSASPSPTPTPSPIPLLSDEEQEVATIEINSGLDTDLSLIEQDLNSL